MNQLSVDANSIYQNGLLSKKNHLSNQPVYVYSVLDELANLVDIFSYLSVPGHA